MTTLLIASLYAVKFAGGTPNDFVNTLADATQLPVVMSQGDPKALPAAEFETTDVDEISRALRSKMKLLVLPGTDLVIGDQRLSRDLVTEGRVQRFRGSEDGGAEVVIQGIRAEAEMSRRAELSRPTEALIPVNSISLPTTAIKDGKITFKTEKADSLQLNLFGNTFSKPVRTHWVYNEAPIFLNVKNVPEFDLMKLVAKAVGARLVSNQKEYFFDLDPVEIRKRAVATLQAETTGTQNRRNNSDEQVQARNFRISVINALSPAQLSAALAETGSTAKFDLDSRSPLTRLAVQRVRELDNARQNRPQNGPGGRQPSIMSRIDNSRMATLSVDSRFGVRMEIPILDQNGRPGGVVRL